MSRVVLVLSCLVLAGCPGEGECDEGSCTSTGVAGTEGGSSTAPSSSTGETGPTSTSAVTTSGSTVTTAGSSGSSDSSTGDPTDASTGSGSSTSGSSSGGMTSTGATTTGGEGFACGPDLSCDRDSQYCEQQVSDVVGVPDSWFCIDAPAACPGPADCECLADEPCADFQCNDRDGITLVCPGG